jgi:hypothetical protein
MSAIRLGIVNEVETAGSQSQPMLLILVATTPGHPASSVHLAINMAHVCLTVHPSILGCLVT